MITRNSCHGASYPQAHRLALPGKRGVGLARATVFFVLALGLPASRSIAGEWLRPTGEGGAFALVGQKDAAPIWVDSPGLPGVLRAARDLGDDVQRVSGQAPPVGTERPAARRVVLIGTVGRSAAIDGLVRAGKLDVTPIEGRWEAFLVQVVPRPLPGIDEALVIAGSDKRGTIYGTYELSARIGVSPWYWWADVPVPHHEELLVAPGRFVETGPAVKYRGIFLNDEAPALSGWAQGKFGGFNHLFYERIFELLLRLRANTLWPAMWGSAFNEDDPLDAKEADDYGIVMGTSHHEPMLRAQQEWKRHGSGPWDYAANGPELREFWTEGVRRNRAFESLYTVGMRGDGDLPMSESSNVALLERIVADQRSILAKEVNPDLGKVPQVWALYKEVQDYYERGMRVPDDVTLLWCDDNWGNLRRLPTPQERTRAGGAGIYYHLDYVGAPRNYKWLDTVPITKVWEQMHLAAENGADRLWIVNVGSFKEKEFPMEFFLRYAWDPRAIPYEGLGDYTRQWAERAFGPLQAGRIAAILEAYAKFNYRRKPELLDADTFSLVNYGESEAVVQGWEGLVAEAEAVQASLPPEARDAFYELVLHPVKASANLNELYRSVGLNRLHAQQGRAAANTEAEGARALFKEDAELTRRWDNDLAGGKWRHFMDQTHIGYTSWQQPDTNVMPAVSEVQVPRNDALPAVAIEGCTEAWPFGADGAPGPRLRTISPYDPAPHAIEVFNRGGTPFAFTTEMDQPWLDVEPREGKAADLVRVRLDVRWDRVPRGASTATITMRNPVGGKTVRITVPVFGPGPLTGCKGGTFVEGDGYVSVEAEHFSGSQGSGAVQWKVLPDFGRTLSGVTTFPVTAASQVPPGSGPRLDYNLYLFGAGEAEIDVITAPTLAYAPGRGLRYAVALDDEAPQVVDLAVASGVPGPWERMVADAAHHSISRHRIGSAGAHVLKVWGVDPGVVLEKIVVNTGGLRPSYLGPPESVLFQGPMP